jgi:hypothetical protein
MDVHEFRFWAMDAVHKWTKMPCMYKEDNGAGKTRQDRKVRNEQE